MAVVVDFNKGSINLFNIILILRQSAQKPRPHFWERKRGEVDKCE